MMKMKKLNNLNDTVVAAAAASFDDDDDDVVVENRCFEIHSLHHIVAKSLHAGPFTTKDRPFVVRRLVLLHLLACQDTRLHIGCFLGGVEKSSRAVVHCSFYGTSTHSSK
jgi:hypothetical protein